MATAKNWKDRADALVQAIKDVAPPMHPLPDMPGTRQHGVLFEAFVDALTDARQEADDWWQTLIDTENSRTQDEPLATSIVASRHPTGPVTYGSVIQTVRTYWLHCVELNGQAGQNDEAVAPEELIMLWLVRSPHQSLARFLAGLPFWPMGLDDAGQWV